MYRAILNDENICVGICNDTPLFTGGILVERDVTGMKYDNGEWVEVEQEKTKTQLDRIESVVNDIAKNNTSYAEMAQAIAEGVNDIE